MSDISFEFSSRPKHSIIVQQWTVAVAYCQKSSKGFRNTNRHQAHRSIWKFESGFRIPNFGQGLCQIQFVSAMYPRIRCMHGQGSRV